MAIISSDELLPDPSEKKSTKVFITSFFKTNIEIPSSLKRQFIRVRRRLQFTATHPMNKEVSVPKVLFLVDDDPDDQDIFQEALRTIDENIVCYVAHDGKEALAKLQDSLLLPDAVFLDLNMPVMSGKECLKALKKDKDLRNIPVIIYSTASADKERENCIQLGAFDFISKPPQFNTLVTTLRDKLLNSWPFRS